MKTFGQFLSEEHDLHHHIEAFKKHGEEHGEKEYGGKLSHICHEPGNCSMISNNFSKHLTKHGIKHKVLSVHGPKPKHWDKAVDDEGNSGHHTAVQVGHHVVDFTHRQFDRKSDFPRITHVDHFKKEWEHHD